MSNTITTNIGIRNAQPSVKVTYPRQAGATVSEGTAFHDGADGFRIAGDEVLYIYKGEKRIAAYRDWTTVELIEPQVVVVPPVAPTLPFPPGDPYFPGPPITPGWPVPFSPGRPFGDGIWVNYCIGDAWADRHEN